MRKWIRTAIIGAVVAWTGGAASALNSTDDGHDVMSYIGSCPVIYKKWARQHQAQVTLFDSDFGYYYSGGSYYDGGGTRKTGPMITAEAIEKCLGLHLTPWLAGSVTSLTQKGADAVDFAAQEYMGFSFTLTTALQYVLDAGYHEYYIGTPNSAPTAYITRNNGRYARAATVTLDGTGSTDPDEGDTLTYAWTQTSGTPVTLSSAVDDDPTFTVPALEEFDQAETYEFSLIVTDDKGNASAPDTVTIIVYPPDTPGDEFVAAKEVITQVIADDAQRSSNSTLASNTRLTHDARERFLTSRTQMQSDGAGLASRNNIALDVDGIAVATPEQMSTQGMFFAQTGNFEGTQRRLVFGDFDIQRDGDTGSTTATINGKIAWEQMLSEQTMLGYYLGGEVARSNIRGSFKGTQDKYGVSVGGYFVHVLQENLFLDGFASLGAGRNDLEMADDTLALTSKYTTQTVTLGAAVSGVIEQNGYNVLPELSVAYGRTTIGNVGFTGVDDNQTDDTLSLDAGSVSTATIMFRPEFRAPMDGLAASESRSVFSFAPRVMCERVKVASTTDNCGSGAELGISSSSSDGLTSVNATIIADRVGNSTRRSLQFNLKHKF